MSQLKEQEQPQNGIPTDLFWAFMDFNEGKRKKSTGPKKTISKPEIEKKIPAQIPCLKCKRCLVSNPKISDGIGSGYCQTCWANR
jgi:hypothetical protein